MKKRGMSNVIITLLLIGLSILALGITWAVIRDIISQSSAGIGIERFTLNLKIDNAYQSGNSITLILSRETGSGNLAGAAFIFYNTTDSETIEKDFSMNQLETKTFSLAPSKLDASTITKVSVAPMFISSSSRKTVADVTDTFFFNPNSANNGNSGNNGSNNNNQQQCSPACFSPTPICLSGACVQCQSINDCPAGTKTCTNNVCVPESCVPEPESITCGTWQCGMKYNNCGTSVNCPVGSSGECTGDRFCNQGICQNITPINIGIVRDTWPSGINMYFSSESLSSTTNFKFDYITFDSPSAEINCLLIIIHQSFNPPLQNKSNIGFDWQTNISAGDHYRIWNSNQKPDRC